MTEKIPAALADTVTGEVVDVDGPDVSFEPAADGSQEVAVRPSQEISLFGPGGPEVALARVEDYANHLKEFVKAHDLTLEMEDGSDYLLTPAWEALGQMLGIFAEVELCEPFKDGWHARAFAHRYGERLTARYGLCLRSEIGKQYKPETELEAMAQTRACRNALKAAMNIVVNAAGYDAAPAEERTMTPKQRGHIFAMLAQLQKLQPKAGKDGWKNWLTDATLKRFGQRLSGLNRLQAIQVEQGLEKMIEELTHKDAGERTDWIPDEAALAEAEAIDL